MAEVPSVFNPGDSGTYWQGSDGQVWVSGDTGINAAGTWDNNTDSYWGGQGFRRTADPVTNQNWSDYPSGTTEGSPNPTSTSWYTGMSGTGAAGTSADPIETWLLDQQISSANSGLGRIDGQRQTGLANINSTFNNAETQRQNQFNEAQGKYDQQVGRNNQDYTNIRSGVRRDAGNQYTALQRLLGSAGAGRSSAAQILTPFAVGREAAQRFGQTQDTFSRNSQDLDTSWNATQLASDAYRTQLEDEKKNKITELNSGLAQSQLGLNDQLYGLALNKQQLLGGNLSNVQQAVSPYQSKISDLLNQIDGYGKLAVTPTQSIGFDAPELGNYNYSRFATPTVRGQSAGAQDYLSPFVQLTSNRDDEERLKVR